MKYIEQTNREKNEALRELIYAPMETVQLSKVGRSDYNKWYYKTHKDIINEHRKINYLNKKKYLNKVDKKA